MVPKIKFRTYGIILQVIIIVILALFAYFGNWIAFFLVSPSLFGDWLLKLFDRGKIPLILKIIFLLQGLLVWIFLYKTDSVQNGSKSLVASTKKNVLHISSLYVPKLDVNIVNSINSHSSNRTYNLSVDEVKPYIPESSKLLIQKVFGEIGPSEFPDLKYRSSNEVKRKLQRVFNELPSDGFDSSFKSPCWKHDPNLRSRYGPEPDADPREHLSAQQFLLEDGQELSCLPHIYILGQPKCGTTDLYARLAKHEMVMAPRRKEASQSEPK